MDYEQLLRFVDKPGRYLGNERGAVRKDPASVRLRFALAFPEVYEIAQSHLGLQILYDILNRRPDVFCERVYARCPPDARAKAAFNSPTVAASLTNPCRN